MNIKTEGLEELVEIVGRLAAESTSFESTSVTYEKAEQLMEAVLYCIHEAEESEYQMMAAKGTLSVQAVYEKGAELVKEKVKKALEMYNQISGQFMFYENRCYYDTFVKGLPEFFKWYDCKFEPQNTILTLDYPVLRDISRWTGIDKIYEFIRCVRWEQKFLQRFPEEYVLKVLRKYNKQYQDMIENLCEIVLTDVIEHILAKKPLPEADFISRKEQLADSVAVFVRNTYEDDEELLAYLMESFDDIVVWLKNAAEHSSTGKLPRTD